MFLKACGKKFTPSLQFHYRRWINVCQINFAQSHKWRETQQQMQMPRHNLFSFSHLMEKILVSAICNEGSHQKPQFLDPASIISMLKDACWEKVGGEKSNSDNSRHLSNSMPLWHELENTVSKNCNSKTVCLVSIPATRPAPRYRRPKSV